MCANSVILTKSAKHAICKATEWRRRDEHKIMNKLNILNTKPTSITRCHQASYIYRNIVKNTHLYFNFHQKNKVVSLLGELMTCYWIRWCLMRVAPAVIP